MTVLNGSLLGHDFNICKLVFNVEVFDIFLPSLGIAELWLGSCFGYIYVVKVIVVIGVEASEHQQAVTNKI